MSRITKKQAIDQDHALTFMELRIAELLNERDRLRAEVKTLLEQLKDPNAVHINMLRGTIAKPTIEQIRHLYPELKDQRSAT